MINVDTIVGPATAPGEGGVGIVRLSGPNALTLLDKTFQGRVTVFKMESHRLYHGYVVNSAGERIDEVLAVVMRAPKSYTAEDVVEIHCHGGIHILRSVLNLFLATGARMAAPGEFTQRAFLNGRLDLAQAEAVAEVIHARSERARRVALNQLDGQLSKKIHSFSDKIKSSLALLEAHIDFPDDEVGSLNLSSLSATLQDTEKQITALAESFDVGRVLRDGFIILILGRPNVGKSSLMNALLGEARSIVTEVAGTTRDTLEESLVLSGFPVRLIDAAGVRDTDDPVELEGVRRARSKIGVADLVLFVLDGSAVFSEEDRLVASLCENSKTLVVVNKSDQPQHLDSGQLATFKSITPVSAKHLLGMEALVSVIVDQLSGGLGSGGEDVVITERRQLDALLQAKAALLGFLGSLDNNTPYECLALDLREALTALGQITGETTPDEILNQIFSQFCVGK